MYISPPVKITDYNDYYNHIFEHGFKSSPRGMETSAIQNLSVAFTAGYIPRRAKDNPAIGIVEMFQLIAGVFHFPSLKEAAPNARLDLFSEQTAYGVRLGPQLPRVVEELTRDPFSRRAMAVIPYKTDLPSDRPCTISFQFQRRTGYGLLFSPLDMTVCMRSSDAVWGLPYDLIQFSGVLFSVAAATKTVPGDIVLHLGNAHIYSQTAVSNDSWSWNMLNTAWVHSDWENTVTEAKMMATAMHSRRTLIETYLSPLEVAR